MTYEEIVAEVQSLYDGADISSINEHLAVEIDIRGEGEGAFYIEVADGHLYVAPYEYYDRDVILTISADVLFDIITCRRDIEDLYQEGKIHARGWLDKAFLLQEIRIKNNSVQ